MAGVLQPIRPTQVSFYSNLSNYSPVTIPNWLFIKWGSFCNFLQNFRLDNKQRIKLIENILVISSILTFRLPNELLGIFFLVILSSVIYWVILQKNQLSYFGSVIWSTKFSIALGISGTFSYIVVSLLYLNYTNLPVSAFTIGFSIYFITLFSVLIIALMPEFILPPKE